MAGQKLRRGRRQSGMAVVSVLLIVALITVLALALMARQTTAIRSAQTEQNRAQAHWLLRGEIARVQTVLQAEARRSVLTQGDGVWARPVAGQVIGEVAGQPARVFVEVVDEQAKFNLRNLVDAGQLDQREWEVFQRLCALLGVPGEQAELVARRVLQSTPEPKAGVQNQAPRLRDMVDLLAVPGVMASSVTRLSAHVTILPQRTWINANTAGPQVLAAWVPGLSVRQAQTLLEARDHGQWFINRGDFTHRLQMPELDEAELLIGITSQWFRLSSALQAADTVLLQQALLHDDKQSLPQLVWLREGA
jgi:general secretion pathway protein K